MINPATSWLEIVELSTVTELTVPSTICKGEKITCIDYTLESVTTFDKWSAQISNVVYTTWLSRYPRCQYLIYDNRSKFKVHFCAICGIYGIKHKPTSVKNLQGNAVLNPIHDVVMNMLHKAEIDMANSVELLVRK
jgi:hypothetical protein